MGSQWSTSLHAICDNRTKQDGVCLCQYLALAKRELDMSRMSQKGENRLVQTTDSSFRILQQRTFVRAELLCQSR